MPKLTVDNAEIRTVAVEIKTITVAGRQVTQSVFKQLPERQLIAQSGTLNGIPWGYVNYHPEKCGDDPHLHVVWQMDKDLFRSRVDLNVTYPQWIDAESASAWVDAKVREDAAGLLTGWEPMPGEFTKGFLGVAVRMPMSPEAQLVTTRRRSLENARNDVAKHGSSHLVRVFNERWRSAPASGLDAARAAARAASRMIERPASQVLADAEDLFEKALAALPEVPLVEAEARLLAEIRVEVDRRRRHRDVRRTLAELPQLFIAV